MDEIGNFLKYLENKELAGILHELKGRFGINQTAVAKVLGISIQALTDAKSGRRTFTPLMAEKLLEYYRHEPWAGWLAGELKDLVAPVEQPIVPPPDPKIVVPVDSVVHLPGSETHRIPLLRTPILGDFTAIEDRCERYVELPEWAIPLIPPNSSPYILEVAADDYAGRLRMGDHVLVVQRAAPVREVMIVEHAESLKLARNAAFVADKTGGREEWFAMDSGLPLHSAKPVAAILGAVMARL